MFFFYFWLLFGIIRVCHSELLYNSVEFAASSAGSKPNIIIILADDYGWHNVGWRNSEIRTPNIDTLAKNGIKLMRHYTYKYCSPSRSSLLTGRLPIHVNQNNECNQIVSKSGADLRMTLLSQKMKDAGYATAMTGKWHCGARSLANLPINRGFDSHFGFLKGGEDHITQTNRDGSLRLTDLWLDNGPAFGRNGTFSTLIYGHEAVRVIRAHNISTPLFMYIPFQVTHSPYECPAEYLNTTIKNNKRKKFDGMTNILDEAIGNITGELKSKGIWNNTLLVFSADNGGVYHGGQAGNNYPLRGQKTSSWEGGVRVTAFITGGINVIPKPLRGTEHNGYVHICDWYATLSYLAGSVSDDLSAPIDVPPIDSINMWESLMTPNASSSPRNEIPLSFCYGSGGTDDCIQSGWKPNGTLLMPRNAALIQGHYKLVWGKQNGWGVWTGPVHPNGTADGTDAGCPIGCLFDIMKDPTEHVDLRDQQPDIFNKMIERIQQIGLSVYQTAYSDVPDSICINDTQILAKYHGFLGPRCVQEKN